MNLAHHAKAIARALLGEPNETLSSKTQLRYGTNGSLAIEIAGPEAGQWYDHENGGGGGMLDLIQRQKGFSNGGALDWLRDIGIDLGSAKQTTVAEYVYRDRAGAPVFKVIRKGPKKQFFQARYDPSSGSFVSGKGCMDGVRRVPYRLNEWSDADGIILIPEGEKDVDRLRSLKLLATCNAGGAGNWSRGYAPYFQDRDVVILPDNDQAGREHAREIADRLRPVASRVAILELPGLPDKGDVSDWLDAGHSADELRDLIQKAPDADEVLSAWGRKARESIASAAAGKTDGVTEDELAQAFTRRHRDHLRYVALWGTWMSWDGRTWKREQTLEAFDLARAICRDAANGIANAKLRAKVLSAGTRAAVENLARSDRAHAAVTEQWDRDLFALNEPRSTT